jgi:hypothetical protein
MSIVYRTHNRQAPSERHVRMQSFNRLENKTLIVKNLMAFQEFQIFLLK